MPNSEPPACPSAAVSRKPVAKNSSRPGSAVAGCAGNASLGRRFCNFAQSSSHNNGTAFGRMLCCKLRSSTSGGNYTLSPEAQGFVSPKAKRMEAQTQKAKAQAAKARGDQLGAIGRSRAAEKAAGDFESSKQG